jgi:DNA ligase-1
MITTYSNLYKRDTTGKIRVWFMDVIDNSDGTAAHRATSGLADGEKTTSAWKKIKGKNIGKANETSAINQAAKEVDALYSKKRDKSYFDDLTEVDTSTRFQPMTAHTYDEKTTLIDFTKRLFSQPKLDGIRGDVLSLAGPEEPDDRLSISKHGIWSRGNKMFVSMPHILALFTGLLLKYPNKVFDGELYNHKFYDDFSEISSIVKKSKPTTEDIAKSAKFIQFHCYDIFDGDNPDATFEERFINFNEFPESDSIVKVKTVEIFSFSQIEDQSEKYLEDNYEGQMLRTNDPYQNKKSKHLLKHKPWESAEFPLIALLEGKGNWANAAKRAVVDITAAEDTEPNHSGVGVKCSREALRALLVAPKPTWVTVEFAPGRTSKNKLRFGRITDWGYGKRDY